jgi:tetratricopeptide (TPR) repeat protein
MEHVRDNSIQKLFEIACEYANSHNFDEALKAFNKITDIDPYEKEAWFNKASIYLELKESDEAIACLEEAVKVKPNFLEAIAKLGTLYYNRENYNKAKFWLKKSIDFGISDERLKFAYYKCDDLAIPTKMFFISYSWQSEKDNEFLKRKLLPSLDKCGIEYFIDYKMIPQKDEMKELPWQIEQGLAYCNTVLIIWSKLSSVPYWMQLELCSAIAMHKRIIILKVDDSPLPASIQSLVNKQSEILVTIDSKFDDIAIIQEINSVRNPFIGIVDKNNELVIEKYSFFNVEFEFVKLAGGILNDFMIGRYLITQKQWEAVMGSNPSCFKGDDNRPVESISWEDTLVFINKINDQYGSHFSLLNDFQWEYACRAGGLGNWCFGDNEDTLFEYAWLVDNTGVGDSPGFLTGYGREEGVRGPILTIETSPFKTNSVYTKKPNSWGIYQMHGNVWEWCSSNSTKYEDLKLIRGGSYKSFGRSMRCSSHAYYPKNEYEEDIGFRIGQEI